MKLTDRNMIATDRAFFIARVSNWLRQRSVNVVNRIVIGRKFLITD